MGSCQMGGTGTPNTIPPWKSACWCSSGCRRWTMIPSGIRSTSSSTGRLRPLRLAHRTHIRPPEVHRILLHAHHVTRNAPVVRRALGVIALDVREPRERRIVDDVPIDRESGTHRGVQRALIDHRGDLFRICARPTGQLARRDRVEHVVAIRAELHVCFRVPEEIFIHFSGAFKTDAAPNNRREE